MNGLRKHLSLQAKGLLLTLALFAYLTGSAVYLASERAKGYAALTELAQSAGLEKTLALVDQAIHGARQRVQDALSGDRIGELAELDASTLFSASGRALLEALESEDNAYVLMSRAIERRHRALREAPSREAWRDLGKALDRAGEEVEIRRRELIERRSVQAAENRRQYDGATLASVLLALGGVALFGSIIAYFFARLTHDIRELEAHASRIVGGVRGEAMPVTRDDELGDLMGAVNRMAVELKEREQQLNLEFHRHSHQDKMRAVGALAAGLAHEVNNPLAAVSGLAQELTALEGRAPGREVAERAEQILKQVQRATRAARHLAEAAAPPPPQADWTDLNDLVRRIIQLLAYDRRYRQVAFEMDLDSQLPALMTMGDAIQQVLMQLVTLGCEAVVTCRPGASRRLQIQSSGDVNSLQLRMTMPLALDFADDAVRRTIDLGRAVVGPLGGALFAGPEEGDGRSIRLVLSAQGGTD